MSDEKSTDVQPFVFINGELQDYEELITKAVTKAKLPKKVISYNLLEFMDPQVWQELRDCMDDGPSVYDKNLKRIRRLLKHKKADTWAKGKHGNTILHFAVQSLYPELVALLLEYEASPFTINDNYHTPGELLRTWQMMEDLAPYLRKSLKHIEELLAEAKAKYSTQVEDDHSSINALSSANALCSSNH